MPNVDFVFTKVGRKVVIEELSEIEGLIRTGIPRSNSASGNRTRSYTLEKSKVLSQVQ